MFEVKRLSLPPIQTNCCVLMDKNKHEAIVIDPASNGKYIFDFCQSKELKVSTILLTHGHFDHIGGVDELVQLSGCKVFIHKNDAEMLDDPDKNGFSFFFSDGEMKCSSSCSCIEDGTVFDFAGEKISVVHTPGHSKGSVVYLTDRFAFTGDTIMKGGVGRTDLYGGDQSELDQSLEKIIPVIRDKIIYPGHGPEFEWREFYEL